MTDLEKYRERLEAYQDAINAIDDYFEYSYHSEIDKIEVYAIMGTLTEALEEII